MKLAITNQPPTPSAAQNALDVLSKINADLDTFDSLMRLGVRHLNASMGTFYALPISDLVDLLNILGVDQVMDIMAKHALASQGINAIISASTGTPGTAIDHQLVTISPDPADNPQILVDAQGVFSVNPNYQPENEK